MKKAIFLIRMRFAMAYKVLTSKNVMVAYSNCNIMFEFETVHFNYQQLTHVCEVVLQHCNDVKAHENAVDTMIHELIKN